ncbi:MAG: GNAT family N-acetyltransferase [Nitrospira sp.]|nr:GNAT family N-acetyltransferase [Nitrospira sp.]MBX3338081.1 GNAT family N-acetyltransferase [Nitrospira sp.]MCW5780435.1 GNAT family N-acetyltransferase [Nitrospira sp.]
MTIGIIKTFEGLEAIRLDWEKWQSHPNNDFAQFKMICQLRSEVESPCVTVVAQSGQPNTLLVGRLEHTQFAPSIGYIRTLRIPAKVMTILHQGELGQIDTEVALKLVEFLWSILGSGMADAIEFHYLSDDSPLLKALQVQRPGWLCHKKPRWTTHWEMNLPAEGAFIERKIRAKHRTGIRKKERDLDAAFPGKVLWTWMTEFDDIPSLCTRLEEVAAVAYQRGLGSGFRDNKEFRQRLALFASRGQLRVQLLEIDGRIRAFWYGFLYQGVFHLSETAYDPCLGKYEVGTMIFIRLNDELTKEGVRKLDFGMGDAPYKRRFGDRCWQEGTVRLFAPTAKGLVLRSYIGLFTSIDKFGRKLIEQIGFLDRLKAGWRRRMMRSSCSVKSNMVDNRLNE